MQKINFSAFLMIAMSIFIYLSKDVFLFDSILYRGMSIYALLFLFLGVSILIFQYLRGGFLVKAGGDKYFNVKNISTSSIGDYDIEKLQDGMEGIDRNVVKIINSLDQISDVRGVIDLSENEKEGIVSAIKSSIDSNISSELLKLIDQQYSLAALKKNNSQHLLDMYASVTKRMKELLYQLDRRSSLNLFIGSVTTIGAVFGLAFIVFSDGAKYSDLNSILAHYIPRLSFIVIIEVFSYFFLRLYKQNIEDIKYYNNELTNIDSKIIALKTSIDFGDNQSVKAIIKLLGETERNFILKKGETTVDLEKARDSRASFASAVESITKLLSKSKVKPE